jgi:hypothetical protein
MLSYTNLIKLQCFFILILLQLYIVRKIFKKWYIIRILEYILRLKTPY